MAYRTGDPVPSGYHLESRPRSGLVTAGWVVGGIGYGLGVMSAMAAGFANESSWMAVPFVGPWMTLGRRNYGCAKTEDPDARDGLSCVGDIFAVMALITDGILQTTGGTLLLIGYTATKQELVKDEAIRVMPMRIGNGFGAGVGGVF